MLSWPAGRARRVFLRLLGLVYLIAFGSLAVQLRGLVGEHGILPGAPFLDWARSVYGASAYRLLPTLFWIDASDRALVTAAWAGALLALLLLLGIRPRLLLGLLWVLYLSLSVVGQDFLSFQWDALLVETGLLAILWAPRRFPPRVSDPPPLLASELSALPPTPDRRPRFDPARFLLVFLLFKLMFLSGATKLLSGDPTWRHATALDFHFETQPLPPWTAWYAHHWPAWLHHGLTWFTLVVELAVPWLLLLPVRWQRLRVGAAGVIATLQVGIAATGNYGFFNLLALVLCIPVLDGAPMLRLGRRGDDSGDAAAGRARPWVGVAAAALFGLSLLSLGREIAYTMPAGRGAAWWPAWAGGLMGWVDPFRSVNGYGLFRVMTTERPELVLEGSRDSVQWEPYGFRYKPGDPSRRPGFVAPFHPRLDWQLWFAALGPGQSLPWLETLGERLRAGTPEVLALLGRNPFATGPPRYVRAVLYDHRFTTPEERRRTGAWWVRSPQGTLLLAPAAHGPPGP